MNSFGLLMGILALFIIGLGFPFVILTERWLGYLWWPYFMGLGIVVVLASLFIINDWLSVTTGILGATILWGSTELKEQGIRAALGWFPFNARKIRPPFADIIKKFPAPHL